MARPTQGTSLGYTIADAEHVLKAAKKYRVQLGKIGVTDGEFKKFETLIADASASAGKTQRLDSSPLEDARLAAKNAIGEYRAVADLVAHPLEGLDRKAQAALGSGGKFPLTDAELKAWFNGLQRRMRPFASRLAARGYTKEDQGKLVELGAAYLDAYAAQGKERGEARSGKLARNLLLTHLRESIGYFRRGGRAVLRHSNARAEFDRVHLPQKPARAQAAPPPAAAAAK
jgi:hypothetical protein